MCGICGKLSWTAPPERGVVERMTAKLVHRGPDAQGFLFRGPLAFGHRRLSVIEPSAASDQPMADVDGRAFIIFNGEIYNFREVRRELEALGARFRTQSDTEVILEAYKRWGLPALEKLNGMFALALWDEPARRLVLARDRLGKKPLYYARLAGGGVVFASELKALVEDPAVGRELNPEALSHYLSHNYTLTAAAIFSGVEKLPAAHVLVLEEGKPAIPAPYWDLAAHFREKRRFASEAEAAEAVGELLEDAVRLRLVADVPLGAFLSGGIDSSAIVAAMCRLRPPAENETFSVGFAEPGYSELAEARRVASLLGVEHRDQVVGETVAEELADIVYAADEPFADSSMIPTYYLARHTRRHVTVALSGDGGDELFAGYPTYLADRAHRLTRRLPGWLVRGAGRGLSALVPASRGKVTFDYGLRRLLAGHRLSGPRAHVFWREIFSREEQAELLPDLATQLSAVDPFEPFARHYRDVEDLDPLDQHLYVDAKTWLPDDILVKVDRCAMAHALEPRAPLLDHRLVELAASLPAAWKLKGLAKKHVFKLSQARRLPREVTHRKKAGFNAPVSHWLGGSLARLVEAELLAPAGAALPFDQRFVRRLLDEHARRRADHGYKLFGLLNLALWAKRYGVA